MWHRRSKVVVLLEPEVLILNLQHYSLVRHIKGGVHAWLALQQPSQFRIQDSGSESEDYRFVPENPF